jgi:hypothetical protein
MEIRTTSGSEVTIRKTKKGINLMVGWEPVELTFDEAQQLLDFLAENLSSESQPLPEDQTNMYWFKKLSEKEQKEFLKNLNNSPRFKGNGIKYLQQERDDFKSFTLAGFLWAVTPQGEEYWRKISSRNIE